MDVLPTRSDPAIQPFDYPPGQSHGKVGSLAAWDATHCLPLPLTALEFSDVLPIRHSDQRSLSPGFVEPLTMERMRNAVDCGGRDIPRPKAHAYELT